MAKVLSEVERFERVLNKIKNFGESNSKVMARAELLNRELSTVTPEDLLKQFTI